MRIPRNMLGRYGTIARITDKVYAGTRSFGQLYKTVTYFHIQVPAFKRQRHRHRHRRRERERDSLSRARNPFPPDLDSHYRSFFNSCIGPRSWSHSRSTRTQVAVDRSVMKGWGIVRNRKPFPHCLVLPCT